MSAELPDKLTPITKQELLEALWKSWSRYFGTTPKKESIWVLASQVQLETGLQHCHNFNLGNVKSREGDGLDFQFFACNEILPKSQAMKFHEADPEHAKISTTRSDGSCIIWFYPNHPGCRFRAFRTLLEGTTDYIAILVKRFDQSWPAVSVGDPAEFCRLLKTQGYFTADLASYTSQLVSIYRSFSRLAFDYDSLPMLTAQEQAELDGVLAKSLADLATSVIEDADTEPKT